MKKLLSALRGVGSCFSPNLSERWAQSSLRICEPGGRRSGTASGGRESMKRSSGSFSLV